jgi:hypothetical protein
VPLKVLVPVLPTERFYEAVVAAADLVADEGGTITFLFTQHRPPAEDDAGFAALPAEEDVEALDAWEERMRGGMEQARELLLERGIAEEQVNYAFADDDTAPAVAIADEAAAGAYDVVILSRGELANMPDIPGEDPVEIARELQDLRDEGVRLLVT